MSTPVRRLVEGCWWGEDKRASRGGMPCTRHHAAQQDTGQPWDRDQGGTRRRASRLAALAATISAAALAAALRAKIADARVTFLGSDLTIRPRAADTVSHVGRSCRHLAPEITHGRVLFGTAGREWQFCGSFWLRHTGGAQRPRALSCDQAPSPRRRVPLHTELTASFFAAPGDQAADDVSPLKR